MSDDEWDEAPQAPAHRAPAPAPAAYPPAPSGEWRRGGGRGRGRGRGRDGPAREPEDNDYNWRGERPAREPRPPRQEAGGARRVVSVPSTKVGRIIGKGGSKIRDIQSESGASVRIGDSGGYETEVTLTGTEEAVARAEELVLEQLEEYKPPGGRSDARGAGSGDQQRPDFVTTTPDGYEVIDWDKMNAFHEQSQQEKWAKLPPVVKNFYREDPKVAAMTETEVARWRLANNDIQVKRTFEDKPDLPKVPNPVLTFEQAFQDYPEILEEIYKQNFETPSPIQSQAWPILLRGEDMIGIAQTGTGKTLAFLLPALIHIEGQPTPRAEREGPTVLILAPTRELAIQIEKEVGKYSYRGIKSICVYGGASRKEQINNIKGVDIVIATPGRFNDLVLSRHLKAIGFSYIVLDEADRMLDMGFEPQIRVSLFDVRPDRQTVMTSATWPKGVRDLAKTYMKDPIQVNVGSLDLATVHTVTQHIVFVEEDDKERELYEFIQNMQPDDKIIVFCGKKATASHIFTDLCVKGIEAQAIHGDRDQCDREAALGDMIDGSVNILIATDVASRGIDIQNLTHVINFDFPRHMEEYVHRVGRTGRAGKTGVAISFLTRSDWSKAKDLIAILEEANQEIPAELEQMAQRFESMKLRRDQEGGGGGGRGRGGRGRGGGGRDRFYD